MATCAEILDRIDQVHAAAADFESRGLMTPRIADALRAAREALGSRVAAALAAYADKDDPPRTDVKAAVAHGGKVYTYHRDRGHRLVEVPVLDAAALPATDPAPTPDA